MKFLRCYFSDTDDYITKKKPVNLSSVLCLWIVLLSSGMIVVLVYTMIMTHKEQVKRYEIFLELRCQGKTYEFIGKKYGISKQAVAIRVKRGIPKEYFRPITSPLHVYEILYRKFSGIERTRMLVRIRDNFACQNCGAVRTIEESRKRKKRLFDVHHIDGLCGKKSRQYDKISEMAGLITLCHKCHFNRHDWAGKNGYKK